MHPTDDLARSYLDLRRHLDPAEAGDDGTGHRLGAFDAAAVREHLAALRSLEAAVEELDVASAADEIDRTALLDDLRATMFRLVAERPGSRNPAWWLIHLGRALGPGAGVDAMLARLRAVPAYLESAEAALTEPAGPFVELARELVEPLAGLMTEALARHRADPSWPMLREAALGAESALARFRLVLDTEIAERGRGHDAGAGPEHLDRLLHHQHALRAGAAEVGRQIAHLEEIAIADLEATAADLGGDWRAMLEERLDAVDLAADLAALAGQELERLRAVVESLECLPAVPGLPEPAPLPEWEAGFVWPTEYVPAAGRLRLAEGRRVRASLGPLLAELGVPGAHLQAAHARALSSEVRRMANPLLWGGFGLYALSLLLELDAWPEPGDRLAAQAHLLTRLVLGRIDVGVHAHLLSVPEAESLLATRAGLEPGEARAAVRMVLHLPTQAAGAVAGWQEWQRLRTEMAGDSPAALAAFHARLFEYGGLPAPLVRWGLEADTEDGA